MAFVVDARTVVNDASRRRTAAPGGVHLLIFRRETTATMTHRRSQTCVRKFSDDMRTSCHPFTWHHPPARTLNTRLTVGFSA